MKTITKTDIITRTLEILPGACSWLILCAAVGLAFFQPIVCAVLIITFDFYWIIRTAYLTILLVLARRELLRHKDKNWLRACERLPARYGWRNKYQVVLFPVYREGLEIMRASLASIRDAQYPKDKIIVILSFEERYAPAKAHAMALEEEFAQSFGGYRTTFHPVGLPGESPTKGANATWGARFAKEFLSELGVRCDDVVISCFDADTCVEKQYLGCLMYHFLTADKPHQTSYQPIPVYNNNIWHAPSFARLVEISSSFTQLMESMRVEKFVTFSSHSMSFKTLVDIDYWPKNMVSDDSVIYWKAYLFYKGDYRVMPLYITVSMDAAFSTSLWKTIVLQYKQKRRWAWGIENFPYVVSRF
ncbi:MAG: hypothetical protein NC924_05190, partial [Candidatus Omnitrophica bacterium]|nr:hypothetical protein [Candidatus Omnitrophota bacterium]